MAKVSRVISMEDWYIGMGVTPKRKANLKGIIQYPITPPPERRSITRDKRKTVGKRKGKKK